MAEGQSLKAQNAWLIRAVMLAHLGGFVVTTLRPTEIMSDGASALLNRLEQAAAPGTASLGVIVIASLLLLGLIPSPWRNRIIHWRWTCPLPGARAFTQIGLRDGRVDMSLLGERFGPLPVDEADQDRLFYRIYRGYKDEAEVLDPHRSYLATRDIGIINFILLLALPPLCFVATSDLSTVVVYAACLFGTYVLSALAAQSYAARMVENVLALASQPVTTS